MSTAYALSNEELKIVKGYTDKIKNIIIQNITKSVETKEIEKISVCSELYNILKPFDETLESLDKNNTINEVSEVNEVSVQKRPVGRPRKIVEPTNFSSPETTTVKRPVGRPRKNSVQPINLDIQIKRPVGRPRKNPVQNTTIEPTAKRPVGRPRKHPIEMVKTKRPVGRPKKRIDLKTIENNNDSFYSLNYDFTSRKPMSYTLFNTTKKVKSWKHLLESFCEDIINHDIANIDKLLNAPSLKGVKLNYVNTTPDNMRSPLRVDKDGRTIYFETYGSSRILVDYMNRILECCGMKSSDISIELKNK